MISLQHYLFCTLDLTTDTTPIRRGFHVMSFSLIVQIQYGHQFQSFHGTELILHIIRYVSSNQYSEMTRVFSSLQLLNIKESPLKKFIIGFRNAIIAGVYSPSKQHLNVVQNHSTKNMTFLSMSTNKINTVFVSAITEELLMDQSLKIKKKHQQMKMRPREEKQKTKKKLRRQKQLYIEHQKTAILYDIINNNV